MTGSEPSLACSTCEGGYRAALQLYHGFIRCENGCLGLGSCLKACRFSAIEMNPETGLPVFNPDLCVGSGRCVEACPKGIISLVGETTKILHWYQYTQCLSPARMRVAKSCPNEPHIVEKENVSA